MPERIQLRRTTGWRKPEGAIVVSRPTKWGNPWSVSPRDYIDGSWHVPTRAEAVARYRAAILANDEGARFHHDCPTSEWVRAELAGRDLACWCPLSEPCHADVLLEIANGPGLSPEYTGDPDRDDRSRD